MHDWEHEEWLKTQKAHKKKSAKKKPLPLPADDRKSDGGGEDEQYRTYPYLY